MTRELENPQLRVLLVDDDHVQLRDTGRYLSRNGFSVITCEDGDEAIAAMEGMDFDLVISDVQMPRVNGLSLVDWVGENRPGMRAVVMTAFGSSAVFRSAMKKGAVLYLEKPVDPKLLVEILVSSSGSAQQGEEVLSACIEAEKREGGGEVIVRHGDHIGRIFFFEGKVAWAASTCSPGVFMDTLLEKTGLERTVLETAIRNSRGEGVNIVNQLVARGHINEVTMHKVLLSSTARLLHEFSSWKDARAIFLPIARPFKGRFVLDLSEILEAVRARQG